MSGSRTQVNGSLVGGSTTEGMGNAAADTARGTTRSGASFAAMNISDSRLMAKKAVKPASKRKTNASTGRMMHRSSSQFIGMPTSSEANPPMARRASGVTPLMFTNSSRHRTQSPMNLPGRVQMRRQLELEKVRQMRRELVNRQHRYAEWRQKAGKRRADELLKFEADQANEEAVILEMEEDVAKRRQVNTSNQDNPEEVADKLQQMQKKIDVERAALLK